MKSRIIFVAIAFAVMLVSVFDASAQVKRVQMHIAGYLCGN